MKQIKEIFTTDMFSHFTNISYLPRWGVLLLDLLIIFIAFSVSLVVGSNLFKYGFPAALIPVWAQLLVVVGVQAIFFFIFHTYSGILRYSTFVDTIKVAISVVCAGALLIIVNLIFKHSTTSPTPFFTTSLIIYVFIAICLLFGWRVAIKTMFEYISTKAHRTKKVFIYGTQSAGLSIAKMLKSNVNSPYRPVGFITRHAENLQHSLLGMKVYPVDDKLIFAMKAKNVNDVIVSPLVMQKINPLKDLEIFLENNINLLVTPYFTDFSTEKVEESIAQKVGRIESIKVEDLLERPTINLNHTGIQQILDGNTVMITGAAGSIGSEIVRQVAKRNPSGIILLEMAESPLHDLIIELRPQFPTIKFVHVIADVRNRDMIEPIFKEYKPDVVFHAAAYKHVPLMEDFPPQAILANVLGTKNVADLSVGYGVKRFVMISTDKAVNPTNVMGASKRIAEIYVQSLYLQLAKTNKDCTKFITTRFGNVLGSNGSVVPYFKKQIANGGPITVTHPDIIRYFMTIPEASSLVLEAATLGNGGEIFVFDMGQPVKIADLAKNMIRLAGFVPGRDIEIVYTGLRPGEKLYEELLNQKETTIPTSNEKIMVAKVREYEYDMVSKQVEDLILLAQKGMVFPAVQRMKDIVPEFRSKNSIYEQLDK